MLLLLLFLLYRAPWRGVAGAALKDSWVKGLMALRCLLASEQPPLGARILGLQHARPPLHDELQNSVSERAEITSRADVTSEPGWKIFLTGNPGSISWKISSTRALRSLGKFHNLNVVCKR